MKTRRNELDPEDPRFSAYALGELEGDDLREVEALIASDPAAAAFVDELRATAGAIEAEFAAEIARTQPAPIPVTRPRRTTFSRKRVAVAAGIAVLISGAMLAMQPEWFGRKVDDREVARSSRRTSEADGATMAPTDVGLAHSLVEVDSPGLDSRFDTPEATSASTPPDAHGRLPQNPNVRLLTRPTTTPAAQRTASVNVAAAKPSGAPTAPSAGVYYDDGEDGDYRATTQDFFHRDRLRDGVDELHVDAATRQLDGLDHPGANTEAYSPIVENPFKLATQDPLSTFSIDVDTASYANVRRFLNDGQLPPPDAVRIEELINYFRYDYPAPEGDVPFSTTATVASCPWAPTHQLVQIGLRAHDIDLAKRHPSNLVFLIDVSGSMNEPDKLPLLVRSMRLLVEQLDERDRIAIVVYAGASGLVLPSTTCDMQAFILSKLQSLSAGGSTNGAEGIQLAYDVATKNRITDGQNRVILCTDGDFNVGVTDHGSLVRLIEEKRRSGVFLSVLGFGKGNVKDSTMELLADKGNGNYAYIDSLAEARKVLVSEMGGTLFTVAKDLKLQLEFNPTRVQAWRLIGYENRVLAHQDFNDDTKDAGEIGAGHNVTALYEIVPVGAPTSVPTVDPLRYQQPSQTTSAAYTDELLTLKLRYKAPDSDTSNLLTTPVRDAHTSWAEAGSDFRFAAAVAAFGMVLRHSPNVGDSTFQSVLDLAQPELEQDPGGYRAEFVTLVRTARAIAETQAAADKPKVR